MKRIALIGMLLFSAGWACAQSLSLEFTSLSEARFFFYLNGKRINESPVGHIIIPNLPDAKQHLRIVVDDPYSVTLTRSFRPSEKKNAYDLLFNPVKERILVSRAKMETTSSTVPVVDEEQVPPEPRESDNDKAKAPQIREKWLSGSEVDIKTNKF